MIVTSSSCVTTAGFIDASSVRSETLSVAVSSVVVSSVAVSSVGATSVVVSPVGATAVTGSSTPVPSVGIGGAGVVESAEWVESVKSSTAAAGTHTCGARSTDAASVASTTLSRRRWCM
ncbi:MAG: hypothetical protein M3386_05940, partial [Actinomycetota bacterium]|nr:hypothetical protein [Actinomycetota bacterium]